MTSPARSFFEQNGEFFIGGAAARGPWSAEHCHAGPVAGLVARAVEAAIGPEKALTRLTIDLIRPMPLSGLKIEATPTRESRSLATTSAAVTDRDGRLCASATSLHLAERDFGETPTAPWPKLSLAEMEPGVFPVKETMHGLDCFAQHVAIGFPPGEAPQPGPTTVWMKTPPLLPDEAPSPFQRLCPLADCGNAISRNAEIDAFGFLNPDVTIVAHRRSDAEWLASTARSEWRPNGLGLASAVIQDEDGPIATVLQSLLLSRVG